MVCTRTAPSAPFDAIGRPGEHMDFALSNGMDALALTDHGNMNGFAHQMNHADKLAKKGVKFKAIPGVEAYFLPSLSDWRKLKDSTKAAIDAEKAANKKLAEPGNEMASTEDELQEISDELAAKEGAAGDDEEDDGGTIVENEEESKGGSAGKNKVRDPVKQRSHLVLLAKNNSGLKSIFNMVSDSAADGYYVYPRVDYDILRKHSNGNVIGLTACIAGYPAKIVFDNQINGDWKDWQPNMDNFEKIQDELCRSIEEFQHALGGKENYFLEMQFNKLGAQHLVNMHLIEAAKRTGAQLVVTCDAHYSQPNHWREREIYKAIGWQQKGGTSELPQSVAELKCELYPKNAQQVWDSYKFYAGEQGYTFYDDQIVKEAIERTYDIAHNLIGEVKPNRTVKLPSIEKLMPLDDLEKLRAEDTTQDEDGLAFKRLKGLAIAGLKWRKTISQPYIDRLKYELEVVKVQKFSKYFLTYAKVMQLLSAHMLIGNARGSAGGSLLAYVLNITQMDPIKHDLLFERFMTRKKKCLDPDTYVITQFGSAKMRYLEVGLHEVLTHTGEFKPVVSWEETEHNTLIELETEDGTVIKCSPNHLWVVIRDGKQVEVRADELNETDVLIEKHYDDVFMPTV